MSPEAVTQRLRTMDELWELSMKLTNSKRVNTPDGARKLRAYEIQDAIRQILFSEWDPIGVNDNPNLVDEYDSYIAPVYRLLSADRSEELIIDFLVRTERDVIGNSRPSSEQLRAVAMKLLSLNVKLDIKTDK